MKLLHFVMFTAFGVSAFAGEVELRLTMALDRVAYQTNESVHVAVVRISAQALPASKLAVELNSENGSRMAFSWPLDAVAVAGNDARATEHLYLKCSAARRGRIPPRPCP